MIDIDEAFRVHEIARGAELTTDERRYVVSVIERWLSTH